MRWRPGARHLVRHDGLLEGGRAAPAVRDGPSHPHVARVVEQAVPGPSGLEGGGFLLRDVRLEPAPGGLAEAEVLGRIPTIDASPPHRPTASCLPRYAGASLGASLETERGSASSEGVVQERRPGEEGRRAAGLGSERQARRRDYAGIVHRRGPPEHHVGHFGRGRPAEQESLGPGRSPARRAARRRCSWRLHALGDRDDPEPARAARPAPRPWRRCAGPRSSPATNDWSILSMWIG